MGLAPKRSQFKQERVAAAMRMTFAQGHRAGQWQNLQ